MSMITTSLPRNKIISDNQPYQNTVHTSAYNADMPEVQDQNKSGDGKKFSPGSPNSQTTDGPTDIMTFTMQETELKTQYARQKTDRA